MKKILLALLLPAALAANAAPDAALTRQSTLLQALQESHPDTYNALNGATLADIYQAYNPQLLAHLGKSSDATLNQYVDSFIKTLTRLGEKNPKACHAVLAARQKPTLPDLQLRLGENGKPLDPALKALLADKGTWQRPENADPGAAVRLFEKIRAELQAEGKAEGLAYTLGGQTPDSDAQIQSACDAGITFFKRLHQSKDPDKPLALRVIFAG